MQITFFATGAGCNPTEFAHDLSFEITYGCGLNRLHFYSPHNISYFIISIVPGTSVSFVFDSIDPTFPCGARVHC
jgi:hypothetical protein